MLRRLALRRHSSSVSSFVVPSQLGPEDIILQVYGANTGVGKTILSAALCRAAARSGALASYIKPVQTGQVRDDDAVSRWSNTGLPSPAVAVQTLFHFQAPVSPHVAAALESARTPDELVLGKVVNAICSFLDGSGSQLAPNDDHAGRLVVVETAGGVLSPGPSGTPQADLFRPLRLPVLLVGDGRLGGISATLTALESLLLRGYDVLGVALIEASDGVGNAEAIADRLACLHESVGAAAAAPAGVFLFPPLPPKEESLDAWLTSSEPLFQSLLQALKQSGREERSHLASFSSRARRRLWWPFTQHRGMDEADVTVVDSAHGDYLHTWTPSVSFPASSGSRLHNSAAGAAAGRRGAAALQRQQLGHAGVATLPDLHADAAAAAGVRASIYDGSASWWTQGVGRGGAGGALALASAAGRYGHVMMPGNVHAPALLLAEEMVERGPGKGWASRAFFSDDGSTAVEVALKMAFRLYLKRRGEYSGAGGGAGNGAVAGRQQELAVVAQRGCYHGDTLGAMDVGAPSVYNAGQHPWYRPRGLFLDTPTLAWVGGSFTTLLPPGIDATPRRFPSRDAAFDLQARVAAPSDPLSAAYLAYIRREMDAFEDASGGATKLACLLLEPVVIGAGGMQLVDPLFQNVLVRECRRRGLPIAFDEVFSGLHRLGPAGAAELLGVSPDVACYAKLLTGGSVPMALTLASSEVFGAFDGDAKAEALLHGHSYTAHPIGCAASLHALRTLNRHLAAAGAAAAAAAGGGGPMPDMWGDAEAVRILSLRSDVARCFSLGTVLALELAAEERGYASSAAAGVVAALKRRGVASRPLGSVVYLMVSPLTEAGECRRLLAALEGALDDAQQQAPAEEGFGS